LPAARGRQTKHLAGGGDLWKPSPGRGTGFGSVERDRRRSWPMGLADWPVVEQLKQRDATGLGKPAFSKRSIELTPRTTSADRVGKSVCPYCGVGCGQDVYVRDGKILDI